MVILTIDNVIAQPGLTSFQTGFGSDVIQMIIHAGLMVKFVMLILLLFSLVSWMIIFVKWRLFRRARQESSYFLDLFWEGTEFNKIYSECDDLTFSPAIQLFKVGYTELIRSRKAQISSSSDGVNISVKPIIESVERALRRASISQSNRMERAISFLATTGNTAPFIGLFGTVWGIMESFRGIGLKGSASLAVVAPGISEALIATAAGLAAAIPAVVAFNFFSRRVEVFTSEMDAFSSDFLSVVERQFTRKPGASKASQ